MAQSFRDRKTTGRKLFEEASRRGRGLSYRRLFEEDTSPVGSGEEIFESDPPTVSRGIEQSLEETRGSFLGARAIGKQIGGKEEESRALQEEAGLAFESAQRSGPRVQTVGDIQSVDDFANFIIGGFGRTLPSAGIAAGSAAVTGGVGSLLSTGARKAVTAQVKRTLRRRARERGAAAGLTATSVPQEAGAIFAEARDADSDLSRTEQALAALGGGTVAGALDVLPQMRVLKKTLNPSQLRQARRGIFREVSKQAAAEGVTEASQELIAKATNKYIDDNVELFDEDTLNELATAGALGVIGGGSLGSVSGIAQQFLSDSDVELPGFVRQTPRPEKVVGGAARRAGRASAAVREEIRKFDNVVRSMFGESGFERAAIGTNLDEILDDRDLVEEFRNNADFRSSIRELEPDFKTSSLSQARLKDIILRAQQNLEDKIASERAAVEQGERVGPDTDELVEGEEDVQTFEQGMRELQGEKSRQQYKGRKGSTSEFPAPVQKPKVEGRETSFRKSLASNEEAVSLDEVAVDILNTPAELRNAQELDLVGDAQPTTEAQRREVLQQVADRVIEDVRSRFKKNPSRAGFRRLQELRRIRKQSGVNAFLSEFEVARSEGAFADPDEVQLTRAQIREAKKAGQIANPEQEKGFRPLVGLKDGKPIRFDPRALTKAAISSKPSIRDANQRDRTEQIAQGFAQGVSALVQQGEIDTIQDLADDTIIAQEGGREKRNITYGEIKERDPIRRLRAQFRNLSKEQRKKQTKAFQDTAASIEAEIRRAGGKRNELLEITENDITADQRKRIKALIKRERAKKSPNWARITRLRHMIGTSVTERIRAEEEIEELEYTREHYPKLFEAENGEKELARLRKIVNPFETVDREVYDSLIDQIEALQGKAVDIVYEEVSGDGLFELTVKRISQIGREVAQFARDNPQPRSKKAQQKIDRLNDQQEQLRMLLRDLTSRNLALSLSQKERFHSSLGTVRVETTEEGPRDVAQGTAIPSRINTELELKEAIDAQQRAVDDAKQPMTELRRALKNKDKEAVNKILKQAEVSKVGEAFKVLGAKLREEQDKLITLQRQVNDIVGHELHIPLRFGDLENHDFRGGFKVRDKRGLKKVREKIIELRKELKGKSKKEQAADPRLKEIVEALNKYIELDSQIRAIGSSSQTKQLAKQLQQKLDFLRQLNEEIFQTQDILESEYGVNKVKIAELEKLLSANGNRLREMAIGLGRQGPTREDALYALGTTGEGPIRNMLRFLEDQGFELHEAEDLFIELAKKQINLDPNNVEQVSEALSFSLSKMLSYSEEYEAIKSAVKNTNRYKEAFKTHRGEGVKPQQAELFAVQDILKDLLEAKFDQKIAAELNIDETLLNRIKTFIRDVIVSLRGADWGVLNQNLDSIVNGVFAGEDVLHIEKKNGMKKVNFQEAFDSNPVALEVLTEVSDNTDWVLTGSIAYAPQGTIYRDPNRPIHDLDFVNLSGMEPKQVKAKLKEIFGNRAFIVREFTSKESSQATISVLIPPKNHEIVVTKRKALFGLPEYNIVNSKTGKVAGTFRLEEQGSASPREITTGAEAVLVDVISNDTPRRIIEEPFKGGDGKKYKARINGFESGMEAKLRFSRFKDIWDFNRFFPNANVDNSLLAEGVGGTKNAETTKYWVKVKEEINAYLEQAIGKRARFRKIPNAAGIYDRATQAIYVSYYSADPYGTAFHESMHYAFNNFLTRAQKEDLTAFFGKKRNLNRLIKAIQESNRFNEAAKQKIIDTISENTRRGTEERATYAYQLWMTGEFTPAPATNAIFQYVKDILHNILGILSKAERSDLIFKALRDGALLRGKNDNHPWQYPGIDDTAIKRGARMLEAFTKDHLRPIIDGYVMPVAIWGKTHSNPVVRNIMSKVVRSPLDEDTSPAYMEVKNQRMRQYAQKWFEGTGWDDLSKQQKRAVRDHIYSQKPVEEIQDEVIRDYVTKWRGFMDELHKYMTDAGLEVGYIESYFPRVWDVNQMYENKEQFIQMMQRHEAELKKLNLTPEKAYDVIAMADGTEASLPDILIAIAEKEFAKHRLPPELATELSKLSTEEINNEIERLGQLEDRFIAENNKDELHKVSQKKQAYELWANNVLGTYVHAPGSAVTKHRTFSFLDGEDLSPFLHQDFEVVMQKYIESVVKRTEFARRFGVHGERLREMVAEARQVGLSPKDEELLDNALAAVRGTLGTNINPRFRKISSWLITYQNFRLLSLSAFTAMADVSGILMRSQDIGLFWNSIKVAHKNIAETMFPRKEIKRIKKRIAELDNKETLTKEESKEFTDLKRQKREMRDRMQQIAEELGVIDTSILHASLNNRFGSEYLYNKSETANNMFFKYTGLEYVTNMTRLMATSAALGFIKSHAVRAGEGNARSKQFLDELNLDVADIIVDEDGELVVGKDALIAAFSKMSDREIKDRGLNPLAVQAWAELKTKGVSNIQGVPIPDMENVLKSAGKIQSKMELAVNRFVDQAIPRPNAGDRPAQLSNPHLMLILHLKQFIFTFQTQMLNRVGKQALQGNYKPLIYLSSFIPVIMAVDALRHTVQYWWDEPDWDDDWTAADHVFYAAQRGGLLGMTEFAVDVNRNLGSRRGTGVEALGGPTVEQTLDILRSTITGNPGNMQTFTEALPAQNFYKNWPIFQDGEY